MKKAITFLACSLLFTVAASAQDVHYVQLEATPLAVNPALTGAFDGGVRASALYQNVWGSATIPFVYTGISFDMPVYIMKDGDYVAIGLQYTKEIAGDGNLTNSSIIGSVAYHKLLSVFSNKNSRNADLAVGIQAGYTQQNIDFVSLYMGNAYYYGPYVGGVSVPYQVGLGNIISYYPVNAGVSFSQALAPSFSYIAGISGNNLYQAPTPKDVAPNTRTAMQTQYAGLLGANWQITQRLSLRPAVYYQVKNNGNNIIAGNEFHYTLGKKRTNGKFPVSVFAGGWYTTGENVSITAGAEIKAFRFGISYMQEEHAVGGMEVMLRYTPSRHSSKNRIVPCTRF